MFFDPSHAKKQLSDNDIHLWTINPQAITDPSKLNSLKSILSEKEIEKIQRYRLPKAQHNALITRAFVRTVLSLYIDLKPHDLLFEIAEHGKPELINSPLPLRFNLSHNNNLVICAVCLKHDIGCDIESLSRKISVEAISKRYFAPSEYQSLKDLEASLQTSRFFEYWTLKEAFVKCTGLGISQGLGSFSFEIGNKENRQYNDNIKLNFAADNKQQNNQDYYSCLLYPDSTHCIALCVNCANRSADHKFNLSVFAGDAKLNIFSEIK